MFLGNFSGEPARCKQLSVDSVDTNVQAATRSFWLVGVLPVAQFLFFEKKSITQKVALDNEQINFKLFIGQVLPRVRCLNQNGALLMGLIVAAKTAVV